nr:uncharacterized protein K02A2.6-like [Rhipicephalus microplus]
MWPVDYATPPPPFIVTVDVCGKPLRMEVDTGHEMENLFRGLPHVAVYFEDILVTGANDAEHLRNLRAVLSKLQELGLKLKLEKCHFFVPQVEYLGHIISKESLSPNVDKVAAIQHAPVPQDYLWGISFEAHTDHKPLLGLLGANKPVPLQVSPPVVRWALKLSAYKYELVYKPGKQLGHADALSRLPLPTDTTALPRPAEIFLLEEAYPRLLPPGVVAKATRNDILLSHVLVVLKGKSLPVGPEWNPFNIRSSELGLHEGCLLWGSRVVIPKSLQAQVLGVLHASHPGIEKSKMIARSHVWWPGIDNDIANSVKSCATCQTQHRAAQPVQQTPWSFPQRPWSRLHIDFRRPFLGHTFLVIVDAFSKWIEVFPVSSTSAEATISALRIAFAQHGLPDVIVSDNGPAFTSAQYLEFLTRNGIRRMLVPPYHPASNGVAERVVQTVKNKRKKSSSGNFLTRSPDFCSTIGPHYMK